MKPLRLTFSKIVFIQCVFFMCLCVSIGRAEWIMFSDGLDTYIYNNQSGEIFIRHRLGKKNYEDVFVKMPRGMFPNELDSKTPSAQSSEQLDKDLEQRKIDALKKSQEALNNALEF